MKLNLDYKIMKFIILHFEICKCLVKLCIYISAGSPIPIYWDCKGLDDDIHAGQLLYKYGQSSTQLSSIVRPPVSML